jgi:hypothetical protein
MSIQVVVSSTAAGVSVSGGTAAAITVSSVSASVPVAVGGGIGPAGFVVAQGTATNAFGTFNLSAGDGITISTSVGQFQIASYGTAAVSSLAPVQSVAGRVGNVVLQASDVTAGTFAIGRIPTISYTALANVPVEFAPAAHTHDSAAISSGTLSIARIPTISYTALSNTPATFAPSSHTHSTTDVVAFTAAASAAAPVQSVNSKVGAVSLAAADVGAAAASHKHSLSDINQSSATAGQVPAWNGTAWVATTPTSGGVTSVSGRSGDVTLVKADVGLGSVDNTADASKPVSTAQAAADAAVQAHAIQRANHSGTQLAATISNFATEAAKHGPVVSVAGRTGTVTLAQLASSGTASSTTFLRGDGAWAPAGSTDASSLTSGTISVDRLPANPTEPTGIYHLTGFTSWYWTAPSSGSVARYELQLTFDKGATWSVESTSITSTTFFRAVGWSGPDPIARVRAISANNYIGPWGYEPGDLGAEFYTLPTASGSVLGGVKVGTGLEITSGVLSATGGGSYTLPTASASVLGGIKVGSGLAIASGVLSATGGGGGSANIVEAASASGFPATGLSQTLYVSRDASRVYRWDSSGVYIEIGN